MAGPWEDYASAAPKGPWEDYAEPAPTIEALPRPQQNKSSLSDFGTDLKRGVEGIPGAVTGLIDIPAGMVGLNRPADRAATALGEVTGFQPAKWAKEAEQEYSPKRQEARADIDRAWDEGGVGNIASAYLRNPTATAGNIVESLPGMAVGGAIGKGLAVASKVAPVIAGALGEGVITAGSAMDQTDRAADSTKAALASVAAGALTTGIGVGAGKVAAKLGLEDIQTAMAGGRPAVAVDAAGKAIPQMSALKRIPASMAQEGLLEELPQSMQEQALQNYAEDKPIGQGVARAGVEGALAGAAMGGAVNLRSADNTYAVAIGKAQDVLADQNAPLEQRSQALDFLKVWKDNNHDAAVATEWYQGIQEALVQDQMAKAQAEPVDLLTQNYGGLIIPKRKGNGEQIQLDATETVADEWRGPKALQDEEAPGVPNTVSAGLGVGENTISTSNPYGSGGTVKGVVRHAAEATTEPVDILNTGYGGLHIGRSKEYKGQIPLAANVADAPVGSGAGVGANTISTSGLYGSGGTVRGVVRRKEDVPAHEITQEEEALRQATEPTVAPISSEQRLQEQAKPVPAVAVPGAAALPAVPLNLKLTGKQQPVFDHMVRAMQENRVSDIVDAQGVIQYQKIADALGMARGSAKSFIDQTAKRIAKSQGITVEEFKAALKARATTQRTTEMSDQDKLGMSPAVQASRLNEGDLFGNAETGAEQSMGVIESIGGSQSEVGENVAPPGYVDSVAPSDNAKAAAEAEARAFFAAAFGHPEAGHAKTDWDDTRTDGTPAFADLSARDQAGWILEYADIVSQTNNWDAVEAAQRAFERDLANENDITETTPGITGPADTGADQPRVQGAVREVPALAEEPAAATQQAEEVTKEATPEPANPVEARVAALRERLGAKQNKAVDRLVKRYQDGDIDLQRLSDELENYEDQVEDGVQYSEAAPQGTEAKTVATTLKKLFFSPEKFDKLVRVVQSVSDLKGFAATQLSRASDPTKVQAFVGTDGKVVLISDNIRPGTELGVFLHEVGVHVGMEKLIGYANMEKLSKRVEDWAAQEDTRESEFAKAAVRRAAKSSSANRRQELIAYFVEEAVSAGVDPIAIDKMRRTVSESPMQQWFRTLWAAAKVGLRKLGLGRIDQLTAQNLVDLAYGAAKIELTGAWHGTAANFRNFNHKYMGSGEGAQAFGWGTYLAQAPGIAHGYWQADINRKSNADYFLMADGHPITDNSLARDLEGMVEDDNTLDAARLRRLLEIYDETLAKWGDRPEFYHDKRYLEYARTELSDAIAAGGIRFVPAAYAEGSMMRVDTAIHDDEFLDWDKTLSEQSELVKAAINQMEKPKLQQVGSAWWQFGDYRIEAKSTMLGGKRFYVSKGFEQGGVFNSLKDAAAAAEKRSQEIGHTGQEVYKQLQDRLGSDKAASEYLDSIGIKGIRFLDANSRNMADLALLKRTLAEVQAELATETDATRKADLQVEANELEDEIALASRQTRNLVVFNDRNVQRVMTEVGASTDNIKFGETQDALSAAVEKWKQTVDKYFGKSNPTGMVEVLPSTPASMQALGLPDLPVRADAHVFESPYNHGVKKSQLLRLPEVLAKPVAVFIHTGKDGELSINFLTGEQNAKGNLLAIALKPPQNKPGGKTHFVATVNEHPKHSFLTEIRGGAALYAGDQNAVVGFGEALTVGKNNSRGASDLKERVSSRYGGLGLSSKVLYPSDLVKLIENGSAQFSEAPAAVLDTAKALAGNSGKLLVTDATHTVKKMAYSLASLHDLVDEFKGRIPAIQKWYEAVQNSLAARKRYEAGAEEIAAAADKLKDGTKAVNEFLSKSTFEQKWGYDPKFPGRTVTVDSAMQAAFMRLKPEEQKVVRDVFAHGEKTRARMQKILDDLGIAKVFASGTKLDGPYAPLKRFGDYMSVLKSKELVEVERAERAKKKAGHPTTAETKRIAELKNEPEHYVVSSFDTLGQAKQFAEANKSKFALADAFEKSARVDENRQMNPEVLQKVLSAVHMSDSLPAEARNEMTKLIQDMYFQTLDEQNARTSGLRRMNRAGYDADMIRSFLSHARASAGFLANMEHGGEINDQFYEMQYGAKDETSLARVNQDAFNAIAAHYAENLKYVETPWQDRAMALTSAWQLATSIGYHVTNAMQGIMVTIPKLASDFNNYPGAWKHLMNGYATLKATGMWGNIDLTKVKDENLRAALQRASEMGVLDVGMEEDLTRFESMRTGIAPIDTASALAKTALHKLRRVSRAVETANRVSSAVAGYNMSIEAGKSVKDAQDYAVRVLQTTQGDFSRVGAPLLLKRLPKAMTQYKKYQFMMGALYVKAFRDAFMGADPDTKAIGRRMLAYKLFHTTMAAGVLGMPMMNLAALVFAGLGDGDEPEDLERTLREKIGDPELAALLLHGPLAYMGLDMSAKLGDDKIFSILPYADFDVSSASGVAKTAMGLAGPAASQAGKFAEGVGAFQRGDYYKGLEKFMPKGVESGMKAFRVANEGFTLKNGDVMFRPDDINGFALALDAIGMPSSELKKMEWLRGQQYEIGRFYIDRAKEIEQGYAKAAKVGDSETMSELRQDWMDLQSGKDHMRQYFGDSAAELKRQPISTLLKYPRTNAKREFKLQRAAEY